MRGLFNGAKKMFIHINGEREITDAVNFCISEGITMVIVHGKEADKVAPLLVEHKIPVILDRTHRLPNTEDEDYDLPFCLENYLEGVKVGICTNIRITHKVIGQTNQQWEDNRQKFVIARSVKLISENRSEV